MAKRRQIRGPYKKSQEQIEKKKEVVLYWVSRGKSEAFGCSKADVSYTQHRTWKKEDSKYEDAIEEAIEVGTQGLVDIADSRARRKSDVLLMFLLKSRDARFKDNAQVVIEPPNVTVKNYQIK